MKALIAFLLLCCPAFAQLGASLVPPSSATDTACANGSWQDTATWMDGTVPVAGEKVFIPVGKTVTNNGTTADVLWIHVTGTLAACDHCDTQLNVHTLYVPMGGRLDYGSVGMPRTGKAVIEFTGGESLPGDWQKLSGGLLLMGEFTAHGNERKAWDAVEGELAAGATSLVIANVPFGWSVGDTIIVAGTDSIINNNPADQTTHRYQTEQRTITSIAGRTVTFDTPLKYRHFRWRADLPFHCANLTRNVVIRSRKTDVPNRGHCMFMSPAVDLRYIAVQNCGRTDKSVPVTDPRKDSAGVLVAGSDANPRARYPIHWHRVGNLGPPASIRGIVVDGSPGWGIVNHASNVQEDDCVCVRCFGSAFTTEEGQERGSIRRCLAALNHGQGDLIQSTDGDHGDDKTGNWGTDGSGFWLQGGMVEVSDCVSFDNSGRGFALFNIPLNSYPRYDGAPVVPWIQFPIFADKSLLTPEYASGKWYPTNVVPSSDVPQRVFSRNAAYGNKLGLQCWNSNFVTQDGMPVSVMASLTDVSLWGRGGMCHLEYATQVNIDGLKVIGDEIFRSQFQSITHTTPALYMSRANIAVKRYDAAGMARPVGDIGTAADQATHSVEMVH